ncbi:phage protein NinX family protein [Variovorax sp. UC74_104]|uniref:phage protein NinX family protein n=1 Tax=Variovorax sp. UC74_104 TaxID=3374555 RepID=UPI0037567C52
MKTSELTGTLLDYWVARSEGTVPTADAQLKFMPSTAWAQGGPIIEREKIMVAWNASEWIAGVTDFVDRSEGHISKGPTALVAAMRAFVTSRLGDVVSDDAQVAVDRKSNG